MRVLLAPISAPAVLVETGGEIVLILDEGTTPKPLAGTLRRLLRPVNAQLSASHDG